MFKNSVKKPAILLLIAITVVFVAYFLNKFYFDSFNNSPGGNFSNRDLNQGQLSPTPYIYSQPSITKNQSYRIVLVGDSMTRALGPNANKLREYLIEYYPDSEFVIYNYGYSSTNIESLPERLSTKTEHLGEEKPAILDQGFEILILESFGYNPLSENSIENGLKKQEEILEKSLAMTSEEKPDIAILFMTPIAPDPENFAKGNIDLTPEMRKSWVEERVRYIENFKEFGKEKNIPVIDIYTASLNSDGTINKSYIAGDNIHPSEKGIDLMAREIADFIAANNILPK